MITQEDDATICNDVLYKDSGRSLPGILVRRVFMESDQAHLTAEVSGDRGPVAWVSGLTACSYTDPILATTALLSESTGLATVIIGAAWCLLTTTGIVF